MTSESTRAAAKRRLEAEESAARETRLEALEREEQERREAEADRERREQERQAAREEADRLSGEWTQLAARAEEKAADLVEDLRLLEDLDRQRRDQMHRAGENVPQVFHRATLKKWIDVTFGQFTGRRFDPSNGASLAERGDREWTRAANSVFGTGGGKR